MCIDVTDIRLTSLLFVQTRTFANVEWYYIHRALNTISQHRNIVWLSKTAYRQSFSFTENLRWIYLRIFCRRCEKFPKMYPACNSVENHERKKTVKTDKF